VAKGIVENPDMIRSGSGCGIASLMIHKEKALAVKLMWRVCLFVSGSV
jgi:hypothetical protein